MQKLVTGKQMKELDEETSRRFGVPPVVLMEQAAIAFVGKLMELCPNARHILVVCGCGNNGGDGIAIARLLNQRGIRAKVLVPKERKHTSELFDLQYSIYRKYGYPMKEFDSGSAGSMEPCQAAYRRTGEESGSELAGDENRNIEVKSGAGPVGEENRKPEVESGTGSVGEENRKPKVKVGAVLDEEERRKREVESGSDLVGEKSRETREESGFELAGDESWDCVVDAMFGTGLSRPMGEPYASLAERLNRMRTLRVAVDIASGVSADDGQIPGAVFRADHTITFSFGKLGSYLYPGAGASGRVHVVPIGITEESAASEIGQFCQSLNREELGLFPKRLPDSNKGTYGKLLVIAGSARMAGAAVFSARAAYRTGCGLVKVMTAEENRNVILSSVPEAVLSLYGDHIDAGQLRRELEMATAVVIGPGLGTDSSAREIVRLVLEECRKPLLLDADALNLIAESKAAVALKPLGGNEFKTSADSTDKAEASASKSVAPGDKAEALASKSVVSNGKVEASDSKSVVSTETLCPLRIITPHLGEMSRLTGESVGHIKSYLIDTAESFAQRYGCITVLKDSRTVIAVPERDDRENVVTEKKCFINLSGNSGMSTAGSGDVLTGVIGALLAQGLAPELAAPLGVYIHGLAGDKAAKRLGMASVTASDIISGIPEVLYSCECIDN